MAGPSDPLQAAGDAGGRLDLDHEVDVTHVDAEFEAAGGDDRRQQSGLQVLLDDRPLLVAHRSVVRPGDGHRIAARLNRALGGDLVDLRGDALGQSSAVGEDEGGPMLLDQVDEFGVDVRPDRCAGHRAGRTSGDLGRRAQFRHVRHGNPDLQVPLLVEGRGDDRGRTLVAEEPRDGLHRAHGGGQPDALRRALEQGVESLERQRQVGSALGARDGVDLVDDDRVDAAQGLAGLGGEQQEE